MLILTAIFNVVWLALSIVALEVLRRKYWPPHEWYYRIEYALGVTFLVARLISPFLYEGIYRIIAALCVLLLTAVRLLFRYIKYRKYLQYPNKLSTYAGHRRGANKGAKARSSKASITTVTNIVYRTNNKRIREERGVEWRDAQVKKNARRINAFISILAFIDFSLLVIAIYVIIGINPFPIVEFIGVTTGVFGLLLGIYTMFGE